MAGSPVQRTLVLVLGRIELGVPGTELVVSHEPTPQATLSHDDGAGLKEHTEVHPEYKDAYVAVRDAFVSARRRLQDYAKRLRGEVKQHARAENVGGPQARIYEPV